MHPCKCDRRPAKVLAPAVAEVPVDGADDEAERDGECEAHGVVERGPPVGQHVLLQQQSQLARLRLREGMREVQWPASLRGLRQPRYQLLVLPVQTRMQKLASLLLGFRLFPCSLNHPRLKHAVP